VLTIIWFNCEIQINARYRATPKHPKKHGAAKYNVTLVRDGRLTAYISRVRQKSAPVNDGNRRIVSYSYKEAKVLPQSHHTTIDT